MLRNRSSRAKRRPRDATLCYKRRLIGVEPLESRRLLAATPSGFPPAQILTGYGFDNVFGNGAGQTIAIITAYDNPSLKNSADPAFSTSDLAKFDAQFGVAD